MARIEQQTDFAASQRHQFVDVGRGFDVGAHVMVVGQAHTLGQGEARQFGELVGVLLPGVFGVESRAFHQRNALALNGVGDFAVHQHLGAVFGQQLDMAANGINFFGHRAAGQTAGIPAGHQRQVIRAQYVADTFGVLGEFAVEFETFVADFLAFAQGGAQRRLATEGRQVVVAPGDRVDANSNSGHGCTFYCFT